MELEVYNINGQKTGKSVKLNAEVFGVEPNDNAIYLDVKQHMANKRQGTHKAKERGEISGSTRKIKRQKGTGTARAGSIKSHVFRGGGRVFGPQPRDYSFKLNKKLKRVARVSALSYKAKDNNITIVEDFSFESPKTKNFIDVLKQFELMDKNILVVIDKNDANVYLAMRNLKKAKLVSAQSINTYDVLHASQLLISESSIGEIERLNVAN